MELRRVSAGVCWRACHVDRVRVHLRFYPARLSAGMRLILRALCSTRASCRGHCVRTRYPSGLGILCSSPLRLAPTSVCFASLSRPWGGDRDRRGGHGGSRHGHVAGQLRESAAEPLRDCAPRHRWFSCPTGVPWSFDTVSGSIPACGVGGLWATWATPKPLPGLAHDRFRSSACRCISLRNEQNTLY